jgi:hypothetical protein
LQTDQELKMRVTPVQKIYNQFSHNKFARAGLLAIIIIIYLLASHNDVENGKYMANVSYTNFGTGYQADYTLYVQVKNDRVVHIYFPDGGSLHAGSNNHGYAYRGGELEPFIGSHYAATVIVRTEEGNLLNYYVKPLTWMKFD